MIFNENDCIQEIRNLFSSLSPEMTSTRIASICYNILDLVIQLNQINPGVYRQEILSVKFLNIH
jgi:hypothetical protein